MTANAVADFRVRPTTLDVRSAFDDLLAAGSTADDAMDAVIRGCAPYYTGSDQVPRLSWWVGFISEDSVEPLGRMVMLTIAQEADWGVPTSDWDELARATRLSRSSFERLVGRLVMAGVVRVSGGQLAVESPVTPGLVAVDQP